MIKNILSIMTKKTRLIFSVVFVFSQLTACVDLKPVKTPERTTYFLDAKTTSIKASPTPYSLLVSLPKAGPGLTDNQMAYIEQPYEIKYFTRNRWIDSPANMLLPLMVQTLQNTGRLQAVVSYPYLGDTDLRLDTEMLALQQEFTVKPSRIRLMISAQLINLKTQHIIASKVFNNVQTAEADNPYSGVKAANKAVEQFLIELNQFCIQNTENIKASGKIISKDKHSG